ncbi:MAG: hypothetical protein ACR2QW_04920 [bacterium]
MILLSGYILLGLVFAIAFLFFGFRIILSNAAGSGFLVRVIWTGGAMALWPYLLLRWIRAGSAP